MKTFTTTLAWFLILCLSATVIPAAAWAQQSKAAPAEKINLNSATVEQLATLPGIGPATARSIVEHRTKAGRFNKIEEIINIKGIGEKKFQKIKDRLVV